MQQNDLSDFISHIVDKYEKPIYDKNSENNLISKAENLLMQFGIQPQKTSEKKKNTKTNKSPLYSNFNKKPLKTTKPQISSLIIAPYQPKQAIDSLIEQNEDIISSCSSNPDINDDQIDFLDQLENDNLNESNNNNNKLKKNQHQIKKRTKLNEINMNTLNNLLDEIEADFSTSDKLKLEKQKKHKAINKKFDQNKQQNKIKNENKEDKSENSEDILQEITKKYTSNEDKSAKNTQEDNGKDFTEAINKITKFYFSKYFLKWKSKYNVRNSTYKFMKYKRKELLNFYFHYWAKAKKDQQNIPRIKDFNHLKEIEELGEEYKKQIFLRKFLLIWARQYHLKIQRQIQKQIQAQSPIQKVKASPQKPKKPKMVKKPPPPPIPVDPKMDEMMKQNKEAKDQKLNNVKLQIKQDKIKQQQIQKEMIEAEKKKRMEHLKNLKKQKIERQNKMKNEEEKVKNQRIFSEQCRKAEDHYEDQLKSRVLKSWRSFIYIREQQKDAAIYQFNLFIKKMCFNRIKQKFIQIENKKLSFAIKINNVLLMKRSLLAIKKVKQERKKKKPILIKNTQLHLLRRCFNEWKFNEIDSKRKKKLKSIEFYESHLLKRAFNAFLVATKEIKEDEQRQNMKEKLLQKAHQYLDENQHAEDEPLRLTLSNKNMFKPVINNDNDYEPIQPLNDSMQISLGLLDLNNELKFDSDDMF